LCIERVRGRVRSGGHFVEDAIVRRWYERSLKNFFDLYQMLADEWQVYDNSDRAGSRLVAAGHGLVASVVHEQLTWNEMRRRAGA
jgi:predicted ABC-type ATPase